MISPDCIALIKHYEGCERVDEMGLIHPYKDAAGYPTIGYGNRYYADGSEVRMDDKPITQEEADELLTVAAEKTAAQIPAMFDRELQQHELDALTDFAYNLGLNALRESTLRKRINENAADAQVVYQFNRWVNAGGNKLQGLVRRRQSEAFLFTTGRLNF